LFFFRRGEASKAREQLEPAVLTLHESEAGRQVLTVFQCERMVKVPGSACQATRELLAGRDRLRKPAP
jgi:hypothetical protein